MNTACEFLASGADHDTPLPPPWQGDIDARDENFFAAVGSLINTQPGLALAVCRKAFAQAQARRDNDAAVGALLRLYGVVQNTAMSFPSKSDIWALILERADAVVDPVLVVRLSIIDMVRLVDGGEHAEVLAKGHGVFAKAMAIGSDHVVANVLMPLALALRGVGEPGLALDLLQQMAPLLPADAPYAAAVNASRSNNEAMLWLDLAAMHRAMGDATAADAALGKARKQAELACTLVFPLTNDMLKVVLVDTLIQVLLQCGDALAARAQATRVQSALTAPPDPGTEVWGLLQLALMHIDIHEERDPRDMLCTLQAVERVHGSDFQNGTTYRVVQTALAHVHERLGQYEQALACHKRLTDWQSQTNTAMARERVKMMRHAALAMRTEAAAFIAHDLRTPLAAAQNWLHTVSDERLPPSSHIELLEAALQVRHALAISDQYLCVLRAEFLPTSELQVLDLGALTDDVCESLSPPTASRIRLARDIDIGVEVRGDPKLLTKALAALLNNALARAPAGSVVRVCVARERGADADEVCLSVGDLGGSVPLSTRMRLHQRHAATAAVDAGSLSLVARVVRLHRARLRVDGPPAGGCTVRLSFRLA